MLKSGIKAYQFSKGLNRIKSAKTEEEQRIAAKYLNNLISNEKGVFLKIGQILGSKESSLEEFKTLTESSNSPWKLRDMIPFIEETYNCKISDIFLSLEESQKSASLGQVHRGFLKNGKQIALKIQYPDIKKKINSQLSLLNLLPVASKIGPLKRWGIPISDYKSIIKKTIDEELSYLNEVKNQIRYAKNHMNNPKIITSEIVFAYSRESIYIQSWEEGLHINEVMSSWSDASKREIGILFLECYFVDLFVHGFIQGDTHDGNFLFRKNQAGCPEIILLDFGNCVEIPETYRLALLRLIYATLKGEDIDLLGAMSLIGFDVEKLKHIQDCLPVLMKTLFEPLLADYAYDLKEWNLERKIQDILGEYKWWFRSAGPTLFFQIIKSLSGVINILQKLDAKIQWKKYFQKNTVHLIYQIQKTRIPSIGFGLPSFKSMAKHLNVMVFEGKINTVNLNLPSSVLIDLENLIDPDIQKKLQERNIDIFEIKKEALRNGGMVQTLFELDEGNKLFKVSLN